MRGPPDPSARNPAAANGRANSQRSSELDQRTEAASGDQERSPLELQIFVLARRLSAPMAEAHAALVYGGLRA